MVNEVRLKELFKTLTEIDAPSFKERKMADFLTSKLKELGFELYEDKANEVYGSEAGNLYAYRKGKEGVEPILFSTHMDTVDPAVGKKAIFHEDGKITSDGTTVLGADCNAGTAAILEAIEELKEEDIRPIEILFFIAEERHLQGSKVFDYKEVKSKESYILDKSGKVGTAANQAPTLAFYNVHIKGKASHAGFAPEEGINAIKVAAEAIGELKLGRLDEETTQNIGNIHGGLSSSNIVCEDCRLLGEIRSLRHEKVLEELKKTEAIFQKAAETYGASMKMDVEFGSIAYQTQEDHPSVLRFKRACEKLNLEGTLEKTFGGSDQSNLAINGIYGLVLASAMEQVHSCKEYSTIQELSSLVELVKTIILDEA